jgi:hypothetical protein
MANKYDVNETPTPFMQSRVKPSLATANLESCVISACLGCLIILRLGNELQSACASLVRGSIECSFQLLQYPIHWEVFVAPQQ